MTKYSIHCKINDICIAWILIHCKNNAIHCKINDICTAWMLIPSKNNATHYTINERCTAWMLSHCNNNAIQYKVKDICIPSSPAPPAGSLISPSPAAPKTTQKGNRASKRPHMPLTCPTHGNSHAPQRSERIWKNICGQNALGWRAAGGGPATNTSDPKMCSNAACCALDNVELDASCLAIQTRSSTFCRIEYLNL